MLVISVRERSTRHQVLRDVLGYQDNTVRKLPMEAGHRHTLEVKELDIQDQDAAQTGSDPGSAGWSAPGRS